MWERSVERQEQTGGGGQGEAGGAGRGNREGELQGGEKGAGGDRVGEKKAALFTGRTGRVTWELKAQRLGLNWGPEISAQKP